MIYSDNFLNFWSWYGEGEMNATLKGSKSEAAKSYDKAYKRWVKDNKELPDTSVEAFAKEIRHGYLIHEKNRKNARKSNAFVPRLKNASTWLNQACWEHDVARPSGDYLQDAKEAQTASKCACGGEPIGRTADLSGWICSKCYQQEWVDEIRKTTDHNRIRWTPRNMMGEFPKLEDETWAQWSMRTAQKIVKQAPAHSPLKALQPARQDDRDWFASRGWKA